MDLGTSFDVLSELLEEYESCGRSVERVETTTAPGDSGRLHATVDLRVPLCAASADGPTLSAASAAATDDGRLTVEFDTPVPAPDDADVGVAADTTEARVAGDDLLVSVSLELDPTADAAREPAPESDSGAAGREDTPSAGGDSESRPDRAAHLAAVRDEDLPPYEDTDYLQLLYDTCETFTEMSRVIEMDVSSETVRRYMIEAGIHDPTSYDTSRDDESVAAGAPADDPVDIPDEQLVTDGAGLPGDLQLSDVVAAVTDSMTLYEVQRELGLDGPRTRKLLSQLNLLDLVVRRVDDAPERDRSYEEVAARIRQSAAGR